LLWTGALPAQPLLWAWQTLSLSSLPCRIPGSITSTGLYKEIAKIGKTAAQPFKNIQLSLNDTFNSLGSLSMPAAAKPGQLGGSLGGSRPRSSGSGAGRALPRRSQTGKLHHMYSDSSHGLQDSTSGLGALAGSMDALQASIKESTSLLRLDLQQHTALQVRRDQSLLHELYAVRIAPASVQASCEMMHGLAAAVQL
jgi:hypothetical protein